MGWSEYYGLAIEGIVDLAMGREADLSPARVHRQAARHAWIPEADEVWRLPTHDETPRTRVAVALRRAGPDALADRHTLFALQGLVSAYPTRHQLVLPHGCRKRDLDGLDVRRTRRLDPEDRDDVDGIPAVTVARALVNASRDLRTPAIRTLAIAAVRDDLATLDQLREVLDRLPFTPGRRRLAQVVTELEGDGSDSGFEFTTRDRLQRIGFAPDPDQPTVLVGGARRRIDVAWQPVRVGIECHGYRDHAGAASLDRDATRVNDLVGEGDWQILVLTPQMLHDGWEAFVANLRRCLRRRAAELGIPPPPGCDPR